MIKCVAIDDEPIALSIIKEYCNRHGDIELICFTSPVAGMECIRTYRPDVVFLDIEMNTHNGVTMARDLPEGTCLIFTTAYADYALEGFNVDAVDFLHKPIFYPRFEQAMEKARRYIGAAASAPAPASAGSITLKAAHKNVVIALSDIMLIEAMDNYVKIFRHNLPTVISQITMKEVEAMLPANLFTRIHRSFIIALPYVEKFANRTVYLRDFPRPIPAGRKYIASFNNLSNMIKPQ